MYICSFSVNLLFLIEQTQAQANLKEKDKLLVTAVQESAALKKKLIELNDMASRVDEQQAELQAAEQRTAELEVCW
jgi:hypothetical protein